MRLSHALLLYILCFSIRASSLFGGDTSVQWTKTFAVERTQGANVLVQKVLPSKSGGLFLIGGNDRCGFVVKIDREGHELWTAGFAESEYTEKMHTISSVCEISDDTVYVYGSTGYLNPGVSGPYQLYRSTITSRGEILDTQVVNVNKGFASKINVVSSSDNQSVECFGGASVSAPGYLSHFVVNFNIGQVVSSELIRGENAFSLTPTYSALDGDHYSLSANSFKSNDYTFFQPYILIRSTVDSSERRFVSSSAYGQHQLLMFLDSFFIVLGSVNVKTTFTLQFSKFTQSGELLFQKAVLPDLYLIPQSATVLPDGNIVMCAVQGKRDSKGMPIKNDENSYDGFAACISKNGDVIWTRSFGSDLADGCYGATLIGNQDLVLFGNYGSDGINSDAKMYAERLAFTTTEVSSEVNLPLLKVSPNPCTNRISIHNPYALRAPVHARVSSIVGVVLKEELLNVVNDGNTCELDLSCLATGQYVLQLECEGKVQTTVVTKVAQ